MIVRNGPLGGGGRESGEGKGGKMKRSTRWRGGWNGVEEETEGEGEDAGKSLKGLRGGGGRG